MSHELRTPMHAILSYARLGIDKLAADQLPKQKMQQYFTRIDQGGERLLHLLNDLLDLSKLEAGKMIYHMVKADLQELARACITQFEVLARGRSVTLTLLATSESSAAWCDPDRVSQVLANLMSNAIKFSPSGGGVTVRIAAAECAVDGERPVAATEVSISDQGVGIPPAELDRIFDKFVQSSKTKTGSGGTGLGLSICKEIVQDHGGRIWAERGAAGGAVLRFVLPREAIEQPAAPAARALLEVQ